MQTMDVLVTIVWGMALIFICVMLFWRLWFLRDPKRITPKGDNIICPADGRVIAIEDRSSSKLQIKKGRWGAIDVIADDVAKEYTIVSIMMTPMDVHYQRSPISGKILYSKHTRGSFKNAISDKIMIENEKNEILIQGKEIKVKVIQIAGALARRIISYVRKGYKIEKGERLGLINLGSQVSLIIPRSHVLVQVGDRVKAGETVIC